MGLGLAMVTFLWSGLSVRVGVRVSEVDLLVVEDARGQRGLHVGALEDLGSHQGEGEGEGWGQAQGWGSGLGDG